MAVSIEPVSVPRPFFNVRNSVPVVAAGGAEANDQQCEAIIHMGVETMHTYYPAINFVIWAGQPASEALKNALLETMGEA